MTLNFAALHRNDSHSDVIYNFRWLCPVHTVDAEHIHPLLSVRFERLSVHKAFYRYRSFCLGPIQVAIHRRYSRRQFEVDFEFMRFPIFRFYFPFYFAARGPLDGFAVLMVTIHIKCFVIRFASSDSVGICND